MTKWTPGPWSKDRNGWCVEAELWENQDIINAAPELYEALEKFVTACDAAPPMEIMQHLSAAVDAARAALAKARGES